MASYSQDHRLLSAPIRLHWAGWETDTLSLQQAGWSISVHENMAASSMQIAIQHKELQIQAVSAKIDYQYLRRDIGPDHLRGIVLPVEYFASKLILDMPFQSSMLDYNIATDKMMPRSQFKPVDAMPQLVSGERAKLEDFIHFAPAQIRTREIIVPEPDVAELLAKILERQEPARHERIEQMVKERGHLIRPQQKFHAQIISLVA